MGLSLDAEGLSLIETSSAPSGPAGGVLTGTYPNPGIVNTLGNTSGDWALTSQGNFNLSSANGSSINIIAPGGGVIAFNVGSGDAWTVATGTGHITSVQGARLIAPGVTHQAATIATLPGTPVAGMTGYVTNGTAALAWGDVLTGGGGGDATPYLVWYNGTAWTVVGK